MKKKIFILSIVVIVFFIISCGTALANTTTFWGHTVTYSLAYDSGYNGFASALTQWACVGGNVSSQVTLTFYSDIDGKNHTASDTNGGPSGSTTYHARIDCNSDQDAIGARSYHSVEYHNDGWSTHLYS